MPPTYGQMGKLNTCAHILTRYITALAHTAHTRTHPLHTGHLQPPTSSQPLHPHDPSPSHMGAATTSTCVNAIKIPTACNTSLVQNHSGDLGRACHHQWGALEYTTQSRTNTSYSTNTLLQMPKSTPPSPQNPSTSQRGHPLLAWCSYMYNYFKCPNPHHPITPLIVPTLPLPHRYPCSGIWATLFWPPNMTRVST